MAITNYSELQTAVANWLHRSDLTSIIPDFITLAETAINRQLRIRSMEVSTTVTATANTRAVALPASWLEGKRVYISSSPTKPALEFMSPEDYWDRYVSTTTGTPEVFTIEADNLQLGPIPDAAYQFDVLYYKQPGALSTTAHPTFTANPDLYLFGALVEAQPYVKDDKRFPLWQARFQNALDEARRKDQADRHSGSILRIRTDTQVV